MDRRQRKLERKRRQRAQAKKNARVAMAERPNQETRLIAAAGRAPFGPCFVTVGWDDETAEVPELLTVVVTRRLAQGDLIAGVALVDRTCLGIKNANTVGPLSEGDLDDLVDELGAAHELQPCGPEVAQAVVYHALDYSGRLGFTPHRDFRQEVFGPRPETLVATPWHNAARPLFVSGPYDNVGVVIAKLEAAVGPGNFDVTTIFGGEGDIDDEGDEDDEDVIDIQAEPRRVDR